MSSREPGARPLQKAQTRAALLAAARGCFLERGYQATGAGDVARAAGVAYGTFYVHFASKEALLDQLLDEQNAALATRLGPILARAARGPLAPAVHQAATVFVAHLAANRPLVEWTAARSAVGLDVARLGGGVNPPMVALLTAMLAEVARARGQELDAAELAAHALLAMWLRVGLRALEAPPAARRRAIDLLSRLSVGAVEAAFATPVRRATRRRARKD